MTGMDPLKPLEALLATLPQVGHVEWIGVRPERGAPMIAVHHDIHRETRGDDHIVDTERSLAFAHSIRSRGITIRVLEGYYHEVLQEHGPSSPDG